MTQPQITLEPVDSLTRHDKNARVGDVEAVKESIQTNGWYGAVIAQKSSRKIVIGNHRYQAALELGYDTIPTILLDITDEQAKRMMLADNRTSDKGTYDHEKLEALLKQMHTSDLGLAGTGYNLDDLDAIIRATGSLPEPEGDEPPLPPAKPRTKPGDVWVLGRHRVICGDATKPETYEALMSGKPADVILTDPPYNVDYEGKTKQKLKIENDSMPGGTFHAFLTDAFTAMIEHVKKGGPAYVFHADSNGETFRNAFRTAGFDLKQVLIWVKNQFVLGRQDYQWRHEPILYGWRPGAAHSWYGQFDKDTVLGADVDPTKLKKDELVELVKSAANESTAIRYDRPKRSSEHQTMKPVPLLSKLIQNSTSIGSIVLDPFGGSGSTLMACEQLNRDARIIELDPAYCDVIIDRWQKHTSLEAAREE